MKCNANNTTQKLPSQDNAKLYQMQCKVPKCTNPKLYAIKNKKFKTNKLHTRNLLSKVNLTIRLPREPIT